jgi:hypothetical protein
VAQWTSNPPQEQKTWVRIPPGYKVFRELIAMLLCTPKNISKIEAFFESGKNLDFLCVPEIAWHCMSAGKLLASVIKL